jgi:hypothetical protein
MGPNKQKALLVGRRAWRYESGYLLLNHDTHFVFPVPNRGKNS